MATATETYRYSRLRIAAFEYDAQTVIVGRGVYFPMRSLCEYLGIAPQTQINRIRSDGRFKDALRDLPVPTIKGQRPMVCIRKQDLGRWFDSIEPTHCKLATRANLERFHADLSAAAERLLFGDTRDVVYDPATRASKPVVGRVHLGDCPRCGLSLCLEISEDGNHLAVDQDD